MSQATSMQNAGSQNIGNQQAMTTGQQANAMVRPANQVPFSLLLPVIEPQLDKNRAMQLRGLYVRYNCNEINKEEFVRHVQSLVGDHMLKMAVDKLQHGQLAAKPSSLPMDKNAQNPRLLEHHTDSHGVHKSSNVNATIHKSSNVNATIRQVSHQTFPTQGLGKQRQQHMPFSPPSIANYAGNYYSQFSKQMRQGPVQNASSSGRWQPPIHNDQSLMPLMGYVKQEPFDQMQYQQQHISQLSGPSPVSPESSKEETSINNQELQNVSAENSSGTKVKTPSKEPTVGQKKPLEAPVSSLSKKQNVRGAFSEDHEQLSSGSKEDSRVPEASRKAIQEEERLILQHAPYQVEQFSSTESDIICVHGYKVKRSNATILEAIFMKYGDIATNCIFKTSSTRTHFLEVVCEVVRRIQTDDMIEIGEDIECQVSDAEAANVNVSWIRAHFEAVQKRKDTSENHSLLMKLKENTSLVRRAAQLDLRTRSLELEAAQERFKSAERCVRVLHLVEKNISDNLFESRAKLDSLVNHSVV